MILPDHLSHYTTAERFDLCFLNEEKVVHHPMVAIPLHTIAVYVLWHPDTVSYYIGSAVDATRRLKEHRWCLTMDRHRNKRLQNCYDQSVKFQASIIPVRTPSEALALEQELIDLNKTDPRMLNISLSVSAAMRGRQHSEETKEKMRQRRLGQTLSDEVKKKISEANTGKKRTAEYIERLRADRTGRTHTEETKEGMRIRLLGNQHALGRARTEAEKEAISKAQKGRVFSPEHRARLKASQHARRANNK